MALVLVVGGVVLATKGGDDGGVQSDSTVSASPTASESASGEPTDEPSSEPSDEPIDEPSDEPSDDPLDAPGPAPATGFVGQWRETGGVLLTVGEKYASGEYAGKHHVNIIGSEEGILVGIGADVSGGAFRIAVAPYGSEDKGELRAGTCTRVGDAVKIAWDKGGTDTLDWVG
ncbi:PT domain-containing protein [Streptomyces sp. NPDC018693]|uniref:PT domain-containing protein n=1 Tax=unclassified Streptomyces TaxID=2593676 RepID=UPI00378CFFAA